MKKILLSIISLLLFTSWVFAYNPTTAEKKQLEALKPLLQQIQKTNPAKIERAKTRTQAALKKIADKESQVYYVINYIDNLIFEITNKKALEWPYKVVYIVDGDTIKILKNNEKQTLRLIGIDAPESNKTRYWHAEEYGTGAKKHLSDLIFEKNIFIEYDETQQKQDKYWRNLGYIILNWENINKKMIQDGYAREYTYNKAYKYQKEFLQAQEDAKQNKKWIWENEKEKIKSWCYRGERWWIFRVTEDGTRLYNCTENDKIIGNREKAKTEGDRECITWPNWWRYYVKSNWIKVYNCK